MKQRQIFTLLSSLVVLLLLSACEHPLSDLTTSSTQNNKPTARPNVLLIVTDDQSYPHASAYGSSLVNTPAFDRIAAEGFLFNQTFVSAPSCGPSRASLLTGQPFYRLGAASMNHTVWDASLNPVTDILANAGYAVGYTGKGWAPGNWKVAGRSLSPTGKAYNELEHTTPGRHFAVWDYAANFEQFLNQKDDAPFFFWVGIYEPHRPFDEGIGEANKVQVSDKELPEFLPAVADIRTDMADYAFEIDYQDKQLAKILAHLERRGELENTLIIATSDNGMAFPRAKATVYDSGARVPMAIRWPAASKKGVKINQMVSLLDMAPTLLQAAGVAVPDNMTGLSLLPLMESAEPAKVELGRDALVYGVERHFPGSRPNGAGYPIRALRTDAYLYIRNYTPNADPVGNRPGLVWPKDDPVKGFGDIDGGLSKTYLWEQRTDHPALAEQAFGDRAAEELYDLTNDPSQLNNVAQLADYADIKMQLSAQLDKRLLETGDPRALGQGDFFDKVMQKYPLEGSNASLDEDYGVRE